MKYFPLQAYTFTSGAMGIKIEVLHVLLTIAKDVAMVGVVIKE